jgi:hypothetical protein
MERERRRRRAHQCREGGSGLTGKLRRWAAVKPRVFNSLSSSSWGSARNYDGKRDEGKHGYTFIASNMTFMDRNPGLLGVFG